MADPIPVPPQLNYAQHTFTSAGLHWFVPGADVRQQFMGTRTHETDSLSKSAEPLVESKRGSRCGFNLKFLLVVAPTGCPPPPMITCAPLSYLSA
jgi:hypothetical protein